MSEINIKEVLNARRMRGFEGGSWVDPPGRIWVDLQRASDELFMLMSGKVELTVDGKKVVPKIGEEILIPRYSIRSARTVGGGLVRRLYAYGR